MRRSRFGPAVIGLTLLHLAMTILTPDPALAWEDELFEIFCGHPRFEAVEADQLAAHRHHLFYEKGYGRELDVPAGKNCLPTESRDRLEWYTADAYSRLGKMGFRAPGERLGPRVLGRDDDDRVVRVFGDPLHVDKALVNSPCNGKKMEPGWLSFILVNPANLSAVRAQLAYRMLAHEMVHLVQNSQPLFETGSDHCGTFPDWIIEGTADALSVHLMDRSGLSRYRPGFGVRGAKSVYGLRRWDRGIFWKTKEPDGNKFPQIPEYRASSFWTYLAERYHGGSFRYFARWWNGSEGKAGSDDWLAWLDRRLRSDRHIDGPLYLVFPEFLAHYARWGERKYAKEVGGKPWLRESFDCEDVTLTRSQPHRGVSMSLQPISGQCLRVRVDGLAAGEVARVKILAKDGDRDTLDDLHLAAARLGGKVVPMGRSFDCFDEVKRVETPGVCLSKPFMGTRGGVSEGDGGRWVKTWLVERQEAGGEALENLFIVARVPLDPNDEVHVSYHEQKVRLEVALAVTSLETSSKGKAPKALSAAGTPFETPPIPMKSGEGADELAAAAAGDPQAMSKLPFLILSAADLAGVPNVGELADEGLRQISLKQVEEGESGELEESLLLTLVLERPLVFGSTGTFPALVTGNADVGKAPAMASASHPLAAMGTTIVNNGEEPSGRVLVEEFSEDLLHVKVEGTYCLGSQVDPASGTCRSIETFSGEVLKPFGWAYDAGQAFTSQDTPGIAAYREILTRQLAEVAPGIFPVWRNEEGSGGEAGVGGGDGGGAASGGAAPCDCSCEAKEKFREIGEAMDEAHEKGSSVPMGDLMAQMGCAMECARTWAGCD